MTNERPTPERIFETMNAFQRTEALRGAIQLGLFTAIGAGAGDVGAIARRIGASERGTRILCDYLVVLGFLTKSNGSYGLSPDAAVFLDEKSPAYLGTATRFLGAPQLREAFSHVAEAVKKGGTALPGDGSVERENPLWVEFARGMAPMVRPAAEFIADLVSSDATRSIRKVLDVAAGHGLYGIHVARRIPEAVIYALDWPAVLEVARENAEGAGVADRHRLVPGSAFEVDFGKDFDLVLLTNFFHHFDRDTCVGLMKKVHRALAPGGRAVTLEFVPNEDRVSPPAAASFSFTMLNSTKAGDAYTFAEYDAMFREAGFGKSEAHPAAGLPQTAIVSPR